MEIELLGKPSKRPSVEEAVKALIPERHRGSAWVCGGYAMDPEKASDIDVWILGRWGEVEWANVVLKGIKAHLGGRGLSLDWDPRNGSGSDAPDSSSLVVGGFWPGAGMPFDVLTSSLDISDLIKSFDLSIHQIAKKHVPASFRTSTKRESSITAVASPAQLVSWKTGPLICNGNMSTTAGRYIDICSRYGFKPFSTSIAKVQKEITGMLESGWPAKNPTGFQEGFLTNLNPCSLEESNGNERRRTSSIIQRRAGPRGIGGLQELREQPMCGPKNE